MQHIQKRGDRIAGRLADFCLLNESVVKESDGVLLLLVRVAPRLASLGLLPCRRARNVEPHLHELVSPRRCLLALAWCRAVLAVRLASLAYRELDGDLVAAGEVRVADLRVGDLEGGAVLHVERQLGLLELSLAPVPAAQRVFLVLEVGAVPVLEDLAEALIVLLRGQPPTWCMRCLLLPHLLLESIQLNDTRVPL
jgi:hypothetical protein